MTRGLLLVADGFDESQFEYTYHRFREDAILTDVASPEGGSITGDRGLIWGDTISTADLPAIDRYDVVVVPGGEATSRLGGDDTLLEWMAEYVEDEGILGVIGESVRLLERIGFVDGRTVTGPESLREVLTGAGAVWTGESVTVDANVVSADGTDALPFFISASLTNVLIRQDPAEKSVDRPYWSRPA